MSNFIKYKNNDEINLDLIVKFRKIEVNGTFRLLFLAITEACDDIWLFSSEEERDAVHAAIIKREVEEIKI